MDRCRLVRYTQQLSETDRCCRSKGIQMDEVIYITLHYVVALYVLLYIILLYTLYYGLWNYNTQVV
jgi:hypothetical protein